VNSAPGITIIPADEVLETCVEPGPDGRLWFSYPTGHRVPLVTSLEDPEVLNQGDGEFHPIPVAPVLSAIEELPRELVADLRVRIYLLPYPRSGLLSSSADDHGVYLSPGVLDYSPAQIHFLVGHELGHSYHRTFLPESDPEGWQRYRQIRDIVDPVRYRAGADHANRPHEIFAEDFRYLFGGPLARGTDGIENGALDLPDRVPGLMRFLRGLSGAAPEALTWIVFPNPSSGVDVLRLRGRDGEVAEVAVFDAAGRMRASLPARPDGSGAWILETTGLRALESGAYWLRVGDGTEVTVPLRWIR
jgi:hypothetical protein